MLLPNFYYFIFRNLINLYNFIDRLSLICSISFILIFSISLLKVSRFCLISLIFYPLVIVFIATDPIGLILILIFSFREQIIVILIFS
jgi:hypothetical protein